MAKVGAQRASELTGRSKSTIQRAMNSGKLSFEIDANDRRIIDVSELERVFGLRSSSSPAMDDGAPSAESEMKRAADMLEMERMKMRIRMLEDQLDATKEQVEDLKAQRDQWQRQAQQVLITSQYSQKQAEEYKEELKKREDVERQRRQQMLEHKMKKMRGDNQNAPAKPAQKSAKAEEKGSFQGLWQKIKGTA